MPKPRVKRQLDILDAEAVTHCVDTKGWQLIKQRLEKVLQARLEELMEPLDAVKTAEVRGAIRGLRTALAVPGILIEEGKRGGGEDEANNGADRDLHRG